MVMGGVLKKITTVRGGYMTAFANCHPPFKADQLALDVLAKRLAKMKREQDLYAPVKALLCTQGYTVKGEIGTADLVGYRNNEPPVIVELKLRFSLSLFHQAITRLSISDLVYIAVPKPSGRNARRQMRDNTTLCRRLGLGMITVRIDGTAEIHCDPTPYTPRKSKARSAKMLREFQRIDGDPNLGGSTRHRIMTAYRQDALKCAEYLQGRDPTKGADVAKATGVAKATTLMRTNHYGWFENTAKGIYKLSPQGDVGIKEWPTSQG
jgi:hypothetical protein